MAAPPTETQKLSIARTFRVYAVTLAASPAFKSPRQLIAEAGKTLPPKSLALQVAVAGTGVITYRDAFTQATKTIGAGTEKIFPALDCLSTLELAGLGAATLEILFQ